MTHPITFFEIAGPNAAGLAKFYAAVFGWQTTPGPFPNYFSLSDSAGAELAGGFRQEEKPERVLYVEVTDLEAALVRVVQAGGRVIIPPTNVPGVVHFALFEDPGGNRTGLVQAADPAEELAQIQQRLMQAWVDRDRAYVDRTLATDWTTTDTTGHVLAKAQVMQEAFGSLERRIESGTIDEVKIRLFGDTAVITGHTVAVGSYKGTPASVNLRFTDVFVKRDGRWQAVASQGTLMTP